MRKLLLMTTVLSFIILFSSCEKKERYEAEFLNAFDTVTQIVSYMDDEKEFEKFSELIYNDLFEYHRLFDIYNDYKDLNNIKTINDNAGIRPVKVDRKIIDLIIFSKDAYASTNAKCNIALGSVLEIWHNYREAGIDDIENASLPPMSMLESAMLHTDINDVIIDAEASTVYLADPEMSIDVGAVAKGYAVEQVCKRAEELGYTSVLIGVGGNIRAIGDKDGEGMPWNVGIQNPDTQNSEPTLIMVDIIGKSVVTSGNYERYYMVDGIKYHHIIDPETLMPAEYFESITIITSDSGLADELSTAVYCMPYEQGLALIDSLPDTEAFWVFTDGTIKYSAGFESYISSESP